MNPCVQSEHCHYTLCLRCVCEQSNNPRCRRLLSATSVNYPELIMNLKYRLALPILILLPHSLHSQTTACEFGLASDHDGDGWGYENEQSCIVADPIFRDSLNPPQNLTWKALKEMTLSCNSVSGLMSSHRVGMTDTGPASFVGGFSREFPFPPSESEHDGGSFHGDGGRTHNVFGGVHVHSNYGTEVVINQNGYPISTGYNRHFFRYENDGTIRYDNILSYYQPFTRTPGLETGFHFQFRSRSYSCTQI